MTPEAGDLTGLLADVELGQDQPGGVLTAASRWILRPRAFAAPRTDLPSADTPRRPARDAWESRFPELPTGKATAAA
ncbi:hypothetical protein ABZZ36_43070 [Actinacidiphila glaucinigra]|uniref:hypothetical protein n=1 Tax=Actinacidiphila glaucinigra TaxID=235986 RepID=UPI0033A100A4